jgi:hypothetical protein
MTQTQSISRINIVIYNTGDRYVVWSRPAADYLSTTLGLVGEYSNTGLQHDNDIVGQTQKYKKAVKAAKKSKTKLLNEDSAANSANKSNSAAVAEAEDSNSESGEEDNYDGLPLLLSPQQVYCLYHLAKHNPSSEWTLQIISANSVEELRSISCSNTVQARIELRTELLHRETVALNENTVARAAYAVAMREKYALNNKNKQKKMKKLDNQPKNHAENTVDTQENNSELKDEGPAVAAKTVPIEQSAANNAQNNELADSPAKRQKLPTNLLPESTKSLALSNFSAAQSPHLSLTTLYSLPISPSFQPDSLQLEHNLYNSLCQPRCCPFLAAVFLDLYLQGYWITGGYQFGGHYLLYPGHPRDFHSGFIVAVIPWDNNIKNSSSERIDQDNETKSSASQAPNPSETLLENSGSAIINSTVSPLSAYDLINIARLATNVKKTVIFAAVRALKQPENGPDSAELSPFQRFPFRNAEVVYSTLTWHQNLSKINEKITKIC